MAKVVKEVNRLRLPAYTEEYNHTHLLVPEMFGINNLDEYIIQHELLDFPKLLVDLSKCKYHCYNNGLCLNNHCYCRQGFIGRYCDSLEAEFSPRGIPYFLFQTILLYAFIAGALIAIFVLRKKVTREVEADNQAFS